MDQPFEGDSHGQPSLGFRPAEIVWSQRCIYVKSAVHKAMYCQSLSHPLKQQSRQTVTVASLLSKRRLIVRAEIRLRINIFSQKVNRNFTGKTVLHWCVLSRCVSYHSRLGSRQYREARTFSGRKVLPEVGGS